MRVQGRHFSLWKAAAAIAAATSAVYLIVATIDFVRVKNMTSEMRSVCVGRMLIDVPKNVGISYRRALISGWFIDSIAESKENFLANLSVKEEKLRAARNVKGLPSLELSKEISTPQFSGKIFVFNRESTHWFEGDKRIDANAAEALAYINGNGTSYLFSAQMGGDSVDEVVKLISQLRSREKDEIPRVAGFCIDRAIVLDPPIPQQTEDVTAFFGFPDNRDFGVAFNSAGGLEPSPKLLDRVANSSFDIASRRITLRRGNRTINGFEGQEFAEKFLELNGVTTHSLIWESFSDPKNLLKPELNFELSTGTSKRPGGKPVNASLSDIALLTLWDNIVQTIRVRPTTP